MIPQMMPMYWLMMTIMTMMLMMVIINIIYFFTMNFLFIYNKSYCFKKYYWSWKW